MVTASSFPHHPGDILVCRVQWTDESAVRISTLRAPVLSRTTYFAAVCNLFGPFKAARRFLGAFRKFCQEPRSILSVLFRPLPLSVVAHEQRQITEVRDACAEKLSLRSVN